MALGSNTLFVVGAGASNEVGLPVGSELAQKIAARLDIRFRGFNEQYGQGDTEIYEACRRRGGAHINEYLHACWKIRDGISFAYSIDNFIDTRREDELVAVCGKLAIVRSILEAEHDSRLFVNRHQDNTNPALKANGTWYSELFRLLQNGVSSDRVDHIFDNCSFIVFNYDRCLQHFLCNALVGLYGLAERRASDLVISAKIHHAYGRVSLMPWEREADHHALPFGATENARSLGRLIENIRTYTEQFEDEAQHQTVSNLVDAADTIVFLGFSYLPQNMSFLIDRDYAERRRRVIGTGIGLSKADRTVIENYLRRLSGGDLGDPRDIEIENLKCFDLISQYSRSLAQGVGVHPST